MFIQGILDIRGFEIRGFHKLAVFKSSISSEPLLSFLIYANIWQKMLFFTWSFTNSTKYALDWIFKRIHSFLNLSYNHSVLASQVHPRFAIAYNARGSTQGRWWNTEVQSNIPSLASPCLIDPRDLMVTQNNSCLDIKRTISDFMSVCPSMC